MNTHLPWPGWAEGLIEAHQGPWAGVGGEIYNPSSAVGFSDPNLSHGSRTLGPSCDARRVRSTTFHDTCYKREVLLSYRDQLADLLIAEPVLMCRGSELTAIGSSSSRMSSRCMATPFHLSHGSPSFSWSRCFSDARARLLGWSRRRRFVHVVLAPIIPWARAVRLFSYLLDRHPSRLVHS